MTVKDTESVNLADEGISYELTKQTSPLLDLPPELQDMVLQYLTYPDSISLKITHPYFYNSIRDTDDIAARVTWLLNRAEEGLCIPKSRNLNLKTEQAFLANSEVKMILRDRRSHKECGQLWIKTNREHLSRRNWLYANVANQSGVVTQCLVDPNIKNCTGIQKVMAEQSAIMSIEKRYSSVKVRVIARLSVLRRLPLRISFRTLFCGVVLTIGLVILEYFAQPLNSLIWNEATFTCQGVMLATIVFLVCSELLFPRSISSG